MDQPGKLFGPHEHRRCGRAAKHLSRFVADGFFHPHRFVFDQPNCLFRFAAIGDYVSLNQTTKYVDRGVTGLGNLDAELGAEVSYGGGGSTDGKQGMRDEG